jgi:Domain of unknown function (DUF4124)
LKNFTTFGLGFCVSVFFGLALAAPGQAEEYYTYKDPHGTLVISNKTPPTGSIVVKRHELPEATDSQTQQPHEGSGTQLNKPSEGSPKPSETKELRSPRLQSGASY